MNKKLWLLLCIIALSNPVWAGMVISGANPTLNYVIVYKSQIQVNVSTVAINNATVYYTNMEFDDSATLKNTACVNTYDNDITITSGKTVTGTSNLFSDAAKSGAGTYTNVSGSVWSADPLFISTSDFHLQPTSPCINKGTPVGLLLDYAGNGIKCNPEIGAYEHSRGCSGLTLRGVGPE